jgi:RNA polymerase sigma-70 factor, ECF subfamily
MTEDLSTAEFERARKRLTGLAYRMLGSVAEAEDVVQDAFLRVRAADTEQVADMAGYLHTTVARLCLDRLKSARARREVYVGTWLPEPIVDDAAGPERALERSHDLSFALLMTLERLSPPERTAFLLHDVFGQDYAAIAAILERSEAACRKLAERARALVHEGAPRFETEPDEEQRLLTAFLTASSTGDVGALMQLLSADAVMYTDGGGKRRAALNPIYGPDRIARFFAGITRRPDFVMPRVAEVRRINQLPGCLFTYEGGDVVVGAIEIHEGRIARVYVISNPDKLQHLKPTHN